jgi:hypothetical protein
LYGIAHTLLPVRLNTFHEKRMGGAKNVYGKWADVEVTGNGEDSATRYFSTKICSVDFSSITAEQWDPATVFGEAVSCTTHGPRLPVDSL